MEQLGLFSMFAICAFDDIKTKTVRTFVIIGFGILGIILQIFFNNNSAGSILAGLGFGFIFYIIAILSDEKIGRGDGLIIMVAGIYMGFAKTFELVWISSVIAALTGIFFMLIKGKNKAYELPFIPCMVAGYILMTVGRTLNYIA